MNAKHDGWTHCRGTKDVYVALLTVIEIIQRLQTLKDWSLQVVSRWCRRAAEWRTHDVVCYA